MTLKQLTRILLLGLILSFSSCKKNTKTTESIPKDVNLVMAIDTYSLIKKGKLNSLDEFNFFKTVKKEIHNENKKVSRFFNDIMEDPRATGFDFKKEIFVYVINKDETEQFLSVLFNITNEDKFTKFVKTFITKTELDKDIITAEKYNYIALDREVALGWKNNKAILLTATNYNSRKHLEFEMETLLNLNASKSIKTNSNFSKFYSNKKDVSVWVNTNIIENSWPYKQLKKETDYNILDNTLALHLNFNQDNVHLKTNFTPNKDIKKLLKKHNYFDTSFNTSLLSFFPKEQLGLFSIAFNPKAYLETIKETEKYENIEYEFRKEMKMSLDDLVNAFGGSVIYSLFDVKNQLKTFKKYDYYSGEFKETEEESLTPIMSLAFDIKDKETIQKVISKFPKDEFEKKGNYFEFKIDNQHTAYFSYNDKIGLITNDIKSIKSFENGGLDVATLKNSNFKSSIKNSHSFGYLNINLDEYPKIFQNEIDEKSRRMGKKSFEIWNNFAKSIEINQKSVTSVELKFNLKDSKNNSLYTILNTVDKNYKSLLGM